MKCEHCGKNDVTFVYQSNINGKVEEKHLCAECAEKLGYTKKLAESHARMRNLFANDPFFGGSAVRGLTGTDSFFGGGFGGGLLDSFFPSGMMRRMLDSPFDDFFSDLPALTAGPVREAAEEAPAEQNASAQTQEQPEENRFVRWRKLNALKMEMKKAVHAEDFERAAQLRDEIRAMEGREQNQPGQAENA